MSATRRFLWLAAVVSLLAGCGAHAADEPLRAGRRALNQGAIREALEHFRAAVTAAPSSSAAHSQRGEAAELLGEFDEALDAYRTAATLAPSPSHRIRLAGLAARMGRTDEAASLLQAELSGAWVGPGRLREFLLEISGRLTVVHYYVRLLTRDDVAEWLLEILVESGDRRGALDLARSRGWLREGADDCDHPGGLLSGEGRAILAMLVHPERADCLLPVGQSLTTAGLVRLARLVLLDRIQNSPNRQVRQAAEVFLRYRLPPHDIAKLAESLNIAGYNLQYRFRQPLDAIKAYERAITADPSFTWPYANIARVYATLRQPDEALEWFRKAVAINPDHGLAQFDLGVVAFRLERYDEALAAFQQVVALNPRGALGHANLGRVLLKLGRETEGRREVELAVVLDPSLGEKQGSDRKH